MERPNLQEIQDTLSQLQERLEEKKIRNRFPGISINGMVNNIQSILLTDLDQTEKLFLLLPYLTCYHQQLILLTLDISGGSFFRKKSKKQSPLKENRSLETYFNVPNQIIELLRNDQSENMELISLYYFIIEIQRKNKFLKIEACNQNIQQSKNDNIETIIRYIRSYERILTKIIDLLDNLYKNKNNETKELLLGPLRDLVRYFKNINPSSSTSNKELYITDIFTNQFSHLRFLFVKVNYIILYLINDTKIPEECREKLGKLIEIVDIIYNYLFPLLVRKNMNYPSEMYKGKIRNLEMEYKNYRYLMNILYCGQEEVYFYKSDS